MTGGLTNQGTAALDATLARHVDQGEVPGLVALVARGQEVHVSAIGHQAVTDPAPIGRDAIWTGPRTRSSSATTAAGG